MPTFIGIDIGTSSAKGVLIDASGTLLASASRPYPLSQPNPGWSEQSPADWWTATRDICLELVAAARTQNTEIAAIGLSGQMHGSVLVGRESLNGDGSTASALTPAILWNDQRTQAECAEIEHAVGGKRRLVELVGNAALTGFTLPKLVWIRKHLPEVWANTACIMLPKDFVRMKLTGEAATDVGDASGTLLLNVDRRDWSTEALAALGIDRARLPRLVESCEVSGRITPWAAAETGLKPGTPVIGGSGDNQCGAVGGGVVAPGMVLATLGTSGVVYAHAQKPRKDLPAPGAPAGAPSGRLHTMCAATGTSQARDGWCVTGVMLSAAGSLQWVHDRLFPGSTYDELIADAATAPPGCEGLIFLPYLTGERCPYPDPEARAGWIGLTSRHTRAHLVRAVIEGVTFAMGQILDLVRSTGVPVERVLLGGGGAKSELWRQLQADVYQLPVETTNAGEGPAFGAALMAATGVGQYGSVSEACGATISTIDVIRPSGTSYGKNREAFDRAYGDVHQLNRALSVGCNE